MTFQEAATIPLGFQTAACCAALYLGLPLFQDVSPISGPIVVLGGASSVGMHALQLLRAHGRTRLITTASPHNFGLVQRYGATDVVDRSASAQEIIGLAGGKVPYVIDAVATEATQRLAASIVVPQQGKVAIGMSCHTPILISRRRCAVQRPIAGIEWPIEPPVFTNSYRYLDVRLPASSFAASLTDPQGPSTAPGNGKNPADWEFGLRCNAWLERALAAGQMVGNPVETVADANAGLEACARGVSGVKLVVEM